MGIPYVNYHGYTDEMMDGMVQLAILNNYNYKSIQSNIRKRHSYPM